MKKFQGKHPYEIIIHKSFHQGTQATILCIFVRSKKEEDGIYKASSFRLGMFVLYAHIFYVYIVQKKGPI